MGNMRSLAITALVLAGAAALGASSPAVAAQSPAVSSAEMISQAFADDALRLTGCSATIEWQDRTFQIDRFRVVATCTGTSTDTTGSVPGWTGWKSVSFYAGITDPRTGGCHTEFLDEKTDVITPDNLTVVSKWKTYYADDEFRAAMKTCVASSSG